LFKTVSLQGRQQSSVGRSARHLQADKETATSSARLVSQGAGFGEGAGKRSAAGHQGVPVPVPQPQVELHHGQAQSQNRPHEW
jgi:hypothetical protein